MSTQTGDMQETVVAVFVMVAKIAVAASFAAFILAGLKAAKQFATGFNWLGAALGGAVNGFLGMDVV